MADDNCRVLVVDDNPGMLETLADILRDAGMVVDCAADAPEAFCAMTGQRYDVAVVDMVLPGLSGLEVIKRLRRECPATRIIALTAYTDGTLAGEARAEGADHIVFKPADPLQIIALVRELTGLK
jgi:CheY-like chemotaxis protein